MLFDSICWWVNSFWLLPGFDGFCRAPWGILCLVFLSRIWWEVISHNGSFLFRLVRSLKIEYFKLYCILLPLFILSCYTLFLNKWINKWLGNSLVLKCNLILCLFTMKSGCILIWCKVQFQRWKMPAIVVLPFLSDYSTGSAGQLEFTWVDLNNCGKWGMW